MRNLEGQNISGERTNMNQLEGKILTNELHVDIGSQN